MVQEIVGKTIFGSMPCENIIQFLNIRYPEEGFTTDNYDRLVDTGRIVEISKDSITAGTAGVNLGNNNNNIIFNVNLKQYRYVLLSFNGTIRTRTGVSGSQGGHAGQTSIFLVDDNTSGYSNNQRISRFLGRSWISGSTGSRVWSDVQGDSDIPSSVVGTGGAGGFILLRMEDDKIVFENVNVTGPNIDFTANFGSLNFNFQKLTTNDFNTGNELSITGWDKVCLRVQSTRGDTMGSGSNVGTMTLSNMLLIK